MPDNWFTTERIWLAIGFIGQSFFFMRFVVQWVASERAKRSVIPDAFWWLSILGVNPLEFPGRSAVIGRRR